jgi:hypothetical protein
VAGECALSGELPLQALLVLQDTASSGYQVEDQDDHGEHKQKVNQAAGKMKGEPQEPQHQKNHEDCPEHTFPLAQRAPGKQSPFQGASIDLRLDS